MINKCWLIADFPNLRKLRLIYEGTLTCSKATKVECSCEEGWMLVLFQFFATKSLKNMERICIGNGKIKMKSIFSICMIVFLMPRSLSTKILQSGALVWTSPVFLEGKICLKRLQSIILIV